MRLVLFLVLLINSTQVMLLSLMESSLAYLILFFIQCFIIYDRNHRSLSSNKILAYRIRIKTKCSLITFNYNISCWLRKKR